MLDYVNDPYLRWWVDTATEGLCGAARARVRAEIDAHCAEALEEQRATGLAKRQAEWRVIAGLGHPFVAARRFKRVYLTERQSGQLDIMRRPWRSPVVSLVESSGCVLIGLWMCLVKGSWAGVAFMMAVACWQMFVGWFLVPSLFRRGHPRRALTWWSAHFCAGPFAFALWAEYLFSDEGLHVYWLLLFAVAAEAVVVPIAPLWAKLGRGHQIGRTAGSQATTRHA